MQPLEFLVPLGALESVAEFVPYAVFVLVLLNLATRHLAHRSHVEGAESGDDDEGITRYGPHLLSSALLVLSAFAYLLVEPHAGMVTSVLVLGVVISDFFEFEARCVEARNNLAIEKPKSAMVASGILFLYAGFEALFFLVKPYWNLIV